MAVPSRLTARALLADPRGWIASGLGSGLAPIAPGTFGTLACLPLVYWAARHLPLIAYLMLLFALFALGSWAAHWVIQRFGTEDPGVVVIDEWVGMGITFFPLAYWPRSHDLASGLILAFLVFRVCDIFKPWPACWVDKHIHGGLGAMLDDVLAGVWGAVLMCAALLGLEYWA